MKKKFLYLACGLFCSYHCFGQHPLQKKCDTIFLRNGKKLVGRVTQIEEFVHYQQQSDTTIYHRIGSWRISYIRNGAGKKFFLPLPERYSTTLRQHPLTSPLDKDTIVLKRGKVLVGKINKVDEYIHYTMANDKKNGYKVGIWKVEHIKYANGKVIYTKD